MPPCSSAAALLLAALVPQQNTREVVPLTNSSISCPPLMSVPASSQPLSTRSLISVRPFTPASLFMVYSVIASLAMVALYRFATSARVP